MDNKNYNQEEIFDIFRIKEPHTMEMWNQEWDSEYRSKNIVDIMKLHYMDFATEAPTADSKTVKAGQRQEKRIMIRGHDADGDSLTFHMYSFPTKDVLKPNTVTPPSRDSSSAELRYTAHQTSTGELILLHSRRLMG